MDTQAELTPEQLSKVQDVVAVWFQERFQNQGAALQDWMYNHCATALSDLQTRLAALSHPTEG